MNTGSEGGRSVREREKRGEGVREHKHAAVYCMCRCADVRNEGEGVRGAHQEVEPVQVCRCEE